MNKSGMVAASIGFVCLATACGGEAKEGGGDKPQVGPAHLDPSNFVKTIDNPYLPLEPGTTWEYEAVSSEGKERIVVTVTDKTKVVDGVTATVVRDLVTTADGKPVEDTYDWFAQDKAGNVWYVGEYTEAYEGGKVSTDGSWEAGVDGARAGIVMMAEPKVGATYYQEHYKGEAEDEGEVLAIDESVTGPTGSYDNVVKTADSTALEPEILEHKWYARGIGFVLEEYVKGGDEKVTLVKMTRP
ncbi:hypothetical protein [Aeromicrobium sp.]|uniref:hypothetical protein n=1 Tax=Aeromicrobium sp. TaxID=1871063 RepID=UPI003D6C2A63